MSEDIADLLGALSHRFRSTLRAALLRDAHDIPPFQAKMVAIIGRHPGVPASKLIEQSGRDKAQIARVLKELDERGLIDRHPNPDDRRSQSLFLTPDGETLFATLRTLRTEVGTQMLAGLSADERQQLANLLRRLV